MDFNEWIDSKRGLEGYRHDYQDAYDSGFESGQQSKQAEIDALKNKIQTALNKACMLQNSSGERIYTELKGLLK